MRSGNIFTTTQCDVIGSLAATPMTLQLLSTSFFPLSMFSNSSKLKTVSSSLILPHIQSMSPMI
eukprot:m.304957 g.304957  ORF g.304957 m.304957 type:complete len:64 (+) comp16443_c5_seq2:488-679(+)